ncbi:hypothetical protein T07_14243, partial [Trichinella nelsoni]
LCNSSKNVSPNDGKLTIFVSRVSLCKCEGEYCRWHSATCTVCHPNPENVLITHCIALFGHFGALLQQIR